MHSLLLAACLCRSPPLNGEHNHFVAIFSPITRMGLSDSAYLALLPTCLSCPMFKTFLSAKYPVYLSTCLSILLLVAYSAYSFVFLPYSAYSNVCLPLNLLIYCYCPGVMAGSRHLLACGGHQAGAGIWCEQWASFHFWVKTRSPFSEHVHWALLDIDSYLWWWLC